MYSNIIFELGGYFLFYFSCRKKIMKLFRYRRILDGKIWGLCL